MKKLCQPIVIELGDDNKVTVSHHGLVNVSHEYEVNALYTPIFRLSLLSITQLHTARYTSTFGRGKCSISSTSITITGYRVNDLYIISPATALTSTIPSMSTKSTARKEKRMRASSSAHITVPSIAHSTEPTTSSLHTSSPSAASTVTQSPPTTESPQPLTISESRLWHRRLAHIHPTAQRSLVVGYTKDDSMCTACIQAKHKQKIIRVKTKRTTKPFELIHSDVCGPFSMPTSAGHRNYILFIDDYTPYTSIWVLPDKKSKICTSAYQSLQARVDSMGYEVKRFRCDNGHGEYGDKTFRLLLAARGTTYEPCPPYAHHKNGVAERMIQTITEKARSMMIDSQAPLVFWGEAVNTAVYLHQRTPNKGLTKRDDLDSYQAPYPTPYEMLQAFGKPSHDNDGNEISYKAPLHHLRQFSCYASQLVPELHHHGEFSPRSKPCMMVSYVHDSTTLSRIWDPAFQVVRLQSDVVFDEERNAHALCLQGDKTDIFELPEETEYIEEIDSGDGFLWAQDYETGGDGHLHDHAGTSQTGEGHGNGDHDCTDDHTDHFLPDADNHRSLSARTGVRSRPPDEEDAPPVSRETIDNNRHLRCENDKARLTAAMTKQSCQPQPPRMNRVTRSQVKISANALIIMAKALVSTSINSDPFTYAEAMDSPQRDDWKRAMEVECTSILPNHTFTTINSREARQLRVKPIGSKWV